MASNPAHVWFMRAVFSGVAMLVILLHLMPLSLAPQGWAPPDLLLASAFAWAMRRPQYVPLALLAVLFLLEDLLFQRPPGLWAALSLLAVWQARNLDRRNNDTSFTLEWTGFATALVLITAAERLLRWISFAGTEPLPLVLMETGLTILCYPLVVLGAQFIFGVRRAVPGEYEASG